MFIRAKVSPIKKLVYSILTLIFFITFFTHAGENTLSLLLDPVNYIPKDSNIFTFNATVIADGNGDYWEYGEDLTYYYYYDLYEKSPTYYMISKDNNCTNFNPKNFETWCIKNKRLQNQ